MRAEAGFPWFRAWRTRGQKEGGGVSARPHFANPRASPPAVTDRDTDPLLLDSERRYLENPAGSTRVTWRVVPPHPSIRTAAPFSICVTSVDRRSATTSRLSGSPISTSGLDQGLAILDATFMQASTIMSRRRVLTGRRGSREHAVPSDGLVERLGLA